MQNFPFDLIKKILSVQDVEQQGELTEITAEGKRFYRATILQNQNEGIYYHIFHDPTNRALRNSLRLDYTLRLSDNYQLGMDDQISKLPGFTGLVEDLQEGYGGNPSVGQAWTLRVGTGPQNSAKRIPIGLYAYHMNQLGPFGDWIYMTEVPVGEWFEVNMNCVKRFPGQADFWVRINGVEIAWTAQLVTPGNPMSLGALCDVYHGGSEAALATETVDFIKMVMR